MPLLVAPIAAWHAPAHLSSAAHAAVVHSCRAPAANVPTRAGQEAVPTGPRQRPGGSARPDRGAHQQVWAQVGGPGAAGIDVYAAALCCSCAGVAHCAPCCTVQPVRLWPCGGLTLPYSLRCRPVPAGSTTEGSGPPGAQLRACPLLSTSHAMLHLRSSISIAAAPCCPLPCCLSCSSFYTPDHHSFDRTAAVALHL